jgi:hypothetical protein
MFLNGEYWGIYNLRERQDARYLAAVYGIPLADIELLDNSTDPSLDSMRNHPPAPGSPRQSPDTPEWWRDWVGFIEGLADEELSAGDSQRAIEAAIDVTSFQDFIIANTFAGVADWITNNTRWWRVTPPAVDATAGVRDGRWRFMLTDLDSATLVESPFASSFPDAIRITDMTRPEDPLYKEGLPLLFNRMMSSKELRNQFLNRYADLMNTALHPERTTTEHEALANLLSADMAVSRARWGVSGMDDWEQLVDRHSRFLMERPDKIRAELVDFFGLDGTYNLTIVYPENSGTILINTVDIAGQYPIWRLDAPATNSTSWDGVYFQGVEVTLQARGDGARPFLRWSGIPANSSLALDGSVTFVTSESLTVRAEFGPPDVPFETRE